MRARWARVASRSWAISWVTEPTPLRCSSSSNSTQPRAPSWFELHTREYDATLDFYRDVFGWTTEVASDTPEFRYTTLAIDGEQLAGVMDASAFLPEGVPAGWSVYFRVADTDLALSEVVALGGEVLMGAEDTPYGRLATVADPTGAVFKLHAATS